MIDPKEEWSGEELATYIYANDGAIKIAGKTITTNFYLNDFNRINGGDLYTHFYSLRFEDCKFIGSISLIDYTIGGSIDFVKCSANQIFKISKCKPLKMKQLRILRLLIIQILMKFNLTIMILKEHWNL
jgi:hypothetical protein